MQAFTYTDKTVLITGASMGIGAAFARELASRGAHVVLVARSRDRLEALAATLPRATVIVEDLGRPGAARRVFDAVTAKGLDVDVLINNAGFGSHAPFSDVPLETQHDAIELNITALVELTHAFLPVIERRQGGIIQVSSTAAFQPVPYMAVYGASKAFVLSFSEALWGEYRERGVRVLALCPGATETEFFKRAGDAAAVGKKATPEALVRVALTAFDHNRPSVIHGLANKLTALSSRFATRRMAVKISARVMRPHPAQLRDAPTK